MNADDKFMFELFRNEIPLVTNIFDQRLAELLLDDDDEELFMMLDANEGSSPTIDVRSRLKNEEYMDTILNYSDTEFKEHFCVSRRLAERLADHFEQSAAFNAPSSQYGKLTPFEQLLIFLWFAGHKTASYRDMAERFKVTISTLFRVNVRLINFISGLAKEVIRWPTPDERKRIEAAFREKGFPGVIGAVDGTHIQVDKPHVDPESYRNRDKYFSIHMQAVCDNQLKFRSIFIGFPGSVLDAQVFDRSELGQNLQAMCGDHIILGDGAYPCLRNLITPFRNCGELSGEQNNFNKKLSTARVVVDHSFKLLKQRFRQLHHCKLRSIRNIAHLIRACCVLHNLIIDDDPQTIHVELSSLATPEVEELVHQDEDESQYIPDTREGGEYRNYLLQVL